MTASLIPELNQPSEDSEPREAISMDHQPVYATGYPDSWTAMDDRGFRYEVYSGLWYPQNWPEEVLRRKREQDAGSAS